MSSSTRKRPRLYGRDQDEHNNDRGIRDLHWYKLSDLHCPDLGKTRGDGIVDIVSLMFANKALCSVHFFN